MLIIKTLLIKMLIIMARIMKFKEYNFIIDKIFLFLVISDSYFWQCNYRLIRSVALQLRIILTGILAFRN